MSGETRTSCPCRNCRLFRDNGGKGRAWNCLRRDSTLEPGGFKNLGGSSGAGKAPPATGARAVTAVTAGGRQEVRDFGRPSARPPTAPMMGDGAVAAATARGGQLLAALLQRGATLHGPSQGPGAPTPPRPPLEAGDQALGQGAEERPASAMEAARVPSPAQDQMEVAPESPPPSPSGAAAADAVAPPAEFGNWGVDGMLGGTVPPSRTPQGHFGRAGGVAASPMTAEAVAQLANPLDRAANIEPEMLEDMFEYAFESDDENDAGEDTATIAADGLEKIKWPRTSSGKVFYAIVPVQWPQTTRGAVRSVFGYAQFSFEPVDPADESEGGAEVEEKADVQGQEADQDEDMHDVNHGYTAETDENGQG